jgi:hypothetical protein
MNNYTFFAETIKERISMQDAIAMYAPASTPRHNRIPCPIHNGEKYNLSFTDRVYHCFVCGCGGDVIQFVQHIFSLTFPAALRKINEDFALNIPMDRRMTLREQRDAEWHLREINERQEREKAERIAYEQLYDSLWDEYTRLERNRVQYAPQTMDEEWHPLFCEALRRLADVQFQIDTLL